MKFPCPQCSQRLSAEESMAGQSLECPRCGHLLTVPSSGDTPPVPLDEDTVNPLKPAKAKQPAAEAEGPSPKRPESPGRREPTTIVISNSSNGGTAALLTALLLLGAAFAYWKYHGGSFQQVEQSPTTTSQATPPTQETAHTPEVSPTTLPTPVPESQPTPEMTSLEPKPVTEAPLESRPTAAESSAKPETPSESTDTVPTETPLENLTTDQPAPAIEPARAAFPTGNRMPVTLNQRQQSTSLANRSVTLSGAAQVYLTAEDDPLPGSVVNFASPDAWLFLEKIAPSKVAADLLPRLWVNGSPAELEKNLRVVQYEQGTVIIPHGPDYPAMTVFSGKGANGTPMPLTCYTKYDDASLGSMKGAIGSFKLKRGYMATIAQNENGTGISKNYVAQDKDLEVSSLPAGLDKNVRFIRIFAWRWTSKKGIAGGIWQNLNVDWFYDWNIEANSSLDLEYVPIKQKRHWPGLNQNWKRKGAVHLLGYNEPDRPDQAKMTPDEAIAGWPELLEVVSKVSDEDHGASCRP